MLVVVIGSLVDCSLIISCLIVTGVAAIAAATNGANVCDGLNDVGGVTFTIVDDCFDCNIVSFGIGWPTILLLVPKLPVLTIIAVLGIISFEAGTEIIPLKKIDHQNFSYSCVFLLLTIMID